MTYIRTYQGVRFDFFEASTEDIILEDIAHALANLCRFTGHVAAHYSVAAHSVWCARTAAERSYDVQVQRWCLMHDAAEAYLGDVAKPLKDLLPDYQVFERRVDGLIRERFRLGECPEVVHEIDREALSWEFENIVPQSAILIEDPWVWKARFLREAERLGVV